MSNWKRAAQHQVEVLERLLGRELTREEWERVVLAAYRMDPQAQGDY